MKKCFECLIEKPLDDFYKHGAMNGGRIGKCKECTKAAVRRRYEAKREQIREYERARFKTAHRKAKCIEYQRNRREREPEKNLARQRLGYAVRTGKVVKKPCELCGDPKVQAHHTDYSKPLNVQWLCFTCHRVHGHGQMVG